MLTAWRLRGFERAWRLGRWTESRYTQAGRWLGGGFVAASVFAVDMRNTLAFQLAALLAGALFLAHVLNWRLRLPFTVRRVLPASAVVGQACRYRVEIEQRGQRLEAGLLLQDELETSLPTVADFERAREPASTRRNWFDRVVGFPRWLDLVQRSRGAETEPLALPNLPLGRPVSVDCTLTPRRRGYLHFRAVRLLRPDVLGLTYASAARPAAAALLVLPRLFPVPPFAFPGRRRHSPGGLPSVGAVGDSQEFFALREYRPGDPLRRLHFRSWARSGTPQVKEYLDEYFDRQALVLDAAVPAGCAGRFEDAVSLAASLALSGGAPDRIIDLLFIGARPYRLTAGRGLGDVSALLEALACAEPAPSTAFPALASAVLGHAAAMSGAFIVFVAWDEARAGLVRALRAASVALRAVCIVEPGAIPAGADAAGVTVLTTGDVEAGLRALAGGPAPA